MKPQTLPRNPARKDRPQEILDAARQLFFRQGYRGTSILLVIGTNDTREPYPTGETSRPHVGLSPLSLGWSYLTDGSALFFAEHQQRESFHRIEFVRVERSVVKTAAQVGVTVLVEPLATVLHACIHLDVHSPQRTS